MKPILKFVKLASLLPALITPVAALSQTPQPIFTEVAALAGLGTPGRFTGYTWGDINGDGWPDIFVSNYGFAPNIFALNNGDGTFTSLPLGDPVLQGGYRAGACFADFDNDGLLDLVVAGPGLEPSPQAGNYLWHNDGNNTFSLVSTNGFPREVGSSISPSWADYDLDGWLDLIITDPYGRNHLYHNNGDGTFAKVTTGPVATNFGFGVSATWCDYDDDGYPDLFVVNAEDNSSLNFFYHNNGNGTFTRVTTGPVATDRGLAIAASWGDINNDGYPDLFVTGDADLHNRLYLNNGDGTFTKVTAGPELVNPPNVFTEGGVWGDYDNDGYLDLFITRRGGTNVVYHNNGDGTFASVAPAVSGQEEPADNFCCGWVDYNGDGYLDMFVTRGTDVSLSSCALFRNNGNTNNWLKVRCIGTVSNRSAVGAKVRVQATIAGKTFWQMREINTGDGGFNSVMLAHFGLGDATNVTALRVEWPSGAVQEFQNLQVKQTLTITEPPRLTPLALAAGKPQFSLIGGVGFKYNVQVSSDLTTWSNWRSVTNTSRTITITDDDAMGAQRYYRAVSAQ